MGQKKAQVIALKKSGWRADGGKGTLDQILQHQAELKMPLSYGPDKFTSGIRNISHKHHVLQTFVQQLEKR